MPIIKLHMWLIPVNYPIKTNSGLFQRPLHINTHLQLDSTWRASNQHCSITTLMYSVAGSDWLPKFGPSADHPYVSSHTAKPRNHFDCQLEVFDCQFHIRNLELPTKMIHLHIFSPWVATSGCNGHFFLLVFITTLFSKK